jgi:glycosyltransferase involved in cell wall biosynthesis
MDFSNADRYLTKIRVPRPNLNIAARSRILTLGQDWLSNEPLLFKLVELAAGHSLEAYVYDISYVTGAHFSGWSDNEQRQRRLAHLLRHCTTVFTESRTTASELAKFANSRSMNFRIVRTGLRGKDMPSAKSLRLLRPREPFVLYVSSFNRRKNHEFIVAVWKDLIEANSPIAEIGARLLLVGEVQGESKYGDPEYREALRRFNIEVINDADDRQLTEYYRTCLFTVFPSMQEGWGLPIQESLMNGKVCLTSNTVPAADEIDNAALIKMSPHDFFGWREAIVTWATNDCMRSAFEAQACTYSPPTWDDIANSIVTRVSLP